MPQGIQRGGPWEVTPGDSLDGQPYYRQALTDPDITPEAFTVQVGERWVPSMQTYEWARISLMQPIRRDLPAVLRPVFPYRLFIGQLLGNNDKYLTLLAHETFHAYQGMLAPEKLASSENLNRRMDSRYPRRDDAFQADWQTELDILAEALRTSDRAATLDLAQQFLDTRIARRQAANLSPELVAYEQQREWLEGLARYAELEIWRQASTTGYTPLAETASLSGFDDYAGYDARWSQEIDQMRRMAGDEGDGRFYYSGMAQAFLLDRLGADWKASALAQDVTLEALLAQVVAQAR